MASFDKRGNRWRARVYVKGVRDSKTCRSRAEALAWAQLRESDLTAGKLPERTVAHMLDRYARDVSPAKRGERWEIMRLRALGKDPLLGEVLLSECRSDTIAAWRDARLKQVTGPTVTREMALLKSVFGIARKEWRWLTHDPMADVASPPGKRPRRRRITPDEIRRVRLALGYPVDESPQNVTQRVAMAFLFAIETAMRAGEILTLEWPQIHIRERFVHLDETKNGDERDVPLSRYAIKLLKLLPRDDGPAFGLQSPTRDVLFRRARDNAKLGDLHFHDSRAEAIWRLSKKLDPLQLAKMVGHRDLKSLLIYYAESPSDTAKRLD